MKTIQATVDGFPNTQVQVEMLTKPLGRVVDASLIFNTFADGNMMSPIFVGDFVLLSIEPSGDELPGVVEVIPKVGPRFLSKIICPSNEQAFRTIAISAVLEAEIQVITEDTNRDLCLFVKHDPSIQLKRVAELAGMTRPSSSPRPNIQLETHIPFYADEQEYRLVALAVVLGAEVKTVFYADHDDGVSVIDAAAIGRVVIEHRDDIDFLAIAEAQGLLRKLLKILNLSQSLAPVQFPDLHGKPGLGALLVVMSRKEVSPSKSRTMWRSR
jgi:hypothetical protein